MKHVITIDPVSIDNMTDAIQYVKMYTEDIERKCAQLRRKIAEKIAWKASQGFSTALADDILTGEKRYGNVSVSVEEQGNITVVIADGLDAVFIEFGAGVYYNGSVGSSPHPKGAELGLTIGSFDKGNGAKNVWGFRDEGSGETHLTHGTPAAMPMYRGYREACKMVYDIAREVFGT